MKLHELNNSYHEAIDHSIIVPDSCKMSCAVQCVKPKLEFPQIISCLNDTCSCSFNIDVTLALNQF